MLNAQDKQFKLDEAGRIFYQADATNPMPGTAIGVIRKGITPLSPVATISADADFGGLDKEAVGSRVQIWLKDHIAEVLEPLVALETKAEGDTDAVSALAALVYESMGIRPRADMEDIIAKLDTDDRRVLRTKKIRLGPILVFMPLLNKPAAVRLRGLLWTLWNDRPLPAELPADGIVSFKVDEAVIDPLYYRAIGYPVYGGRAIRVDMLDRIITAVYDGADKGVFQAKHEMAEWLGSSISDLYAVLEAMGHKKVHDPADEVKEDKPEDAKADAAMSVEDYLKPQEEKSAEEKTEESATEEKKAESQEKPELAMFRLRKGKAYGGGESKKPVFDKKKKQDKSKKPPHHQKGKKKDRKPEGPKVITAAAPKAAPEDSPFAILQQLKSGKK